MYERASAKKVFIFGVGAILFGVAVVPLSMQLFIYATNFAVPPNGEIDGNPLLPMQFVILAPLAGIVLGSVFGAIWGRILTRFMKKESPKQSNLSALQVWLGVLLLSPLIVYVFLSRVWAWASDVIPWGISIILAVLWVSGLCCYVIWLSQERFSSQKAAKIAHLSKFKRHVPFILFILLLCSVLLGMIFRIYPISGSFIYLLQGFELNHLIPDTDSMMRLKAYAFNMPAGIHPAVVAVAAFLLSGWQMSRKLEPVKL